MGRCPTDTETEIILTDTDDPNDFVDCTFPVGFTFRIHYEEAVMPDMPDMPEAAPAEATPAEAPSDVEASSEPAPTASTVAAEPSGVADLSSLQGLAGGNSWLLVILALVAVLGGGTAWKFYQQHAAQKHEQAMKRLELEAKAMKVQTTSPPSCQQAHAKMEAQIAELNERLAKTEKKTLALTGSGVDLDELDERVKKLERAKKSSTAKKS